ncbi:hypothetical protein [Nonomuraea sp. KM90]|uniref:hypothetical protein n=1 Tax=Nonomuraea sp. KM90 TaxID=3457428 RepID=UPI003FCCE365
MTAGAHHQRTKELLSPWPADRYEVLCQRSAPFQGSRDRYHFAEHAMEAAQALETAGLAIRVAVIRISDDAVIYDPDSGVELPSEQW